MRKKTAFKKIFIFTILSFFFLVKGVFAAVNINVAILPFSIHVDKVDEVDEKLINTVPLLISEKLKLEKVKTILLKKGEDTDLWAYSKFQELGIKLGMDYLITGSIFVAGKGVSIDLNMINILDENALKTFYSQVFLENIDTGISNLTKEIISAVFHKAMITKIEITGNKRIEADAISQVINSKEGDILKIDNITEDIKKIYKMGYFEEVTAEQTELDKGIEVTFNVVEKPTVRVVKFKKNHAFDDEEIFEIINTRTGSILNINKINADVQRIRMMYVEKNYYNCKVEYEIKHLKDNQANIDFIVDEGKKIKVEKIFFDGNTYFSDKKLKKIIETKEKGVFSFFTSSGNLNEIEVKNDAVRIEALYNNNGFIETKVSDPDIKIGKKSIQIFFKIDEGSKYKINWIQISGDLIIPESEMLAKIKSKQGQLYNRELIRKDINATSDIYLNKGFANVDITPLIKKSESDDLMNVNFYIKKGEPVYFNRINISGNSKTRDKVIRREIKIAEQDLYNKSAIQRSFRNLNRLDYFEQIDIQPVKNIDKNMMDLNVKVVEKNTGMFVFGGGYSSENDGFGMISIAERNLFGKGQNLKFDFKFSESNILYNVNFFEPYIFDSRVSGGVNVYKEEKEYDYYDKDAFGLGLRLGYRIFDYTSIGVHYLIEDFEISNITENYTSVTPGDFLISSIKPYILYDSTNSRFAATEGSKHRISIEHAGEFLGSDIEFTKYFAESGVYFPLVWKLTGMLHAEGGFLDDGNKNEIDIDYERYYLGGMYSIRGFDSTDINGTRQGDTVKRGGEKYVQFNAEMTFPLAEKYQAVGVFFYDRGDVYNNGESINLSDQYSSFGIGFRWNSPIGPLRLEYAWVIDGKDLKDNGDGQFEFSFGAFF